MVSFKARLMYWNPETSKWEMLVPTKGTPSLGGDPNLIDASTNEDEMTVNEEGRKELPALTWTANYNLADYKRLEALQHVEHHYAQYFGPNGDGADGMFEFDGKLLVYPGESESYGLVEMTITIANTTPITRVDEPTDYSAA